jgi:hypothetical protein
LTSTPAPPLLSVVMPTRNQAPFIRAAIDSVLAQAQELPGAVELVVADGASTDATPQLLAALAATHPDVVRWVSEPDRGPADAVNKAVARARGEVVGWLNSDDLYTPGAAARALHALRDRPELVMVYGEGEHVDIDGGAIGRYPTRGPDTPLAAWADGCHICQPTAFFRRAVFDALGGLDTSLRTAFDYEFWLRLLKAYPGRIGFVPATQALSRLHAEGITLRMREQVAMEGMQVVHRHIGPAPMHWLLTHVGEALAACPFDADVDAVRRHLLALADEAAPWLAPGEAAVLRRAMAAQRAWQLARPDLVADVQPDGWALQDLVLRVRQPAAPRRPHQRLRLWGRHASPVGGALRLSAQVSTAAGDGAPWRGGCARNGRFELVLPLPADSAGMALTVRLHAETSFVPAQVVAGSTDTRRLAFLLDAVELE